MVWLNFDVQVFYKSENVYMVATVVIWIHSCWGALLSQALANKEGLPILLLCGCGSNGIGFDWKIYQKWWHNPTLVSWRETDSDRNSSRDCGQSGSDNSQCPKIAEPVRQNWWPTDQLQNFRGTEIESTRGELLLPSQSCHESWYEIFLTNF